MADVDSRCLPDLVTTQAARTPDAVAVVADSGELTYAALVARAGRLAHHLRGLTVDTDTPVAVCLERGLDMVIALLAIQLAGGAYVPLDPDHPVDRLRYLVDDVAAPVLVTSAVLGPRVLHEGATVCLDTDQQAIDRHPRTPPTSRATPDSLAYLIYTSGSTGQPKGVGVPHRGIVNRIRWMQAEYRLDTTDVVLQKTPYGFDVSVWEFFWPLVAGARLIMARPGGHRDPAYLADTIDRYGVTTLHFVPTMLAEFLADARPHPSVRRVICSGEALPRAIAAGALECFTGGVHNLYGPTEASIDVSYHEFRPDTDLRVGVPIGVPITNTVLRVLGPDLAELPAGEVGEIYIGGVGLARGYHARPALTAERFIPDPYGEGRLYRTGDLARRLDDGNLEYLGRTDHQVKIRGNRIELGEIEQALVALPGIGAAAVTVHRSPSGYGRLVAYVAAASLDVAEARAALERRLPDFMMPAQFVMLDRLPVTNSGKTDRAALPTPPDLTGAGTAPRTWTEERLLLLWRDVLELPGIGVSDDFFACGGDSILAIRLVARARRGGLGFTVRDLFEHRTIAALAPVVWPVEADGPREAVPFADSPLPAAELAKLRTRRPDIEDVHPLTPLQEGMLFHWLLDPGRGGYLQQHVYRLDAGLDRELLAGAWLHVLGRHPALRSTVEWDGVAQPVQVVHAAPAADVRIARIDLGTEHRNGFDLAAAPPLRVTLTDDGHMVFTYHHLLLDGWSVAVVLGEVMAAYRALAAGDTPADVPVEPFRSFVAWRASRPFDAARAHWREVLDGAPAATPAPKPAPKPLAGAVSVTTGRDQVGRALPDGLAAALAARAARHGVTLHSAFAGAWAVLVGRHAGVEDVIFGVTVAGRPPELPGVEHIVGLLVNTIPVRVRLTGSYVDLLRAVQRQELASREHEHTAPIDIARAAGRPANELLFESIVVFQNHPPLPDGIQTVRIEESTGYPVTLVIELDGTPRLRLLHQPATVSAAAAARLLDDMIRVLVAWLDDPAMSTAGMLSL